MQKRLTLIALVALLVMPAICYGQTSVTSSATETERFAFIDDVVQQHIDEEKLVGAVTWICHDGQVVHHAAHGLRDRDSASPMMRDAIFRINSFTKAITTTAAMMLWEEGKFSLDDPVEKYLPELANRQVYDPAGNRPASRPMTVRDLMRHTSGLIYGYEGGDGLVKIYEEAELHDRETSLDEFVQRLSKLPLLFSPGEQWQYGVSTDVLGRLVEVWSGQPYEEFLRQRIYKPLGMKDTDFYVPQEKRSRLATLYLNKEDEKLIAHDGTDPEGKHYVPLTSPVRCSPGGGLFSTATDYGTFLQMLLTGGEHNGRRLLQAETVAKMTSNQLPSNVPGVIFGDELRDGFKFGLGFNVITAKSEWDADAAVGEFGWGGSSSCHYWVCPPKKLIVITLEATRPYTRSLELALKGKVYDAIE